MSKIRVLVVEPGKMPEDREIESHIDPIKTIVGGWIEMISLGRNSTQETFALYCNEEALRLGIPFNRNVRGHSILGTFLITKIDSSGDEISLSDEDVVNFTAELANNNNRNDIN